jgi:hypothetical protein
MPTHTRTICGMAVTSERNHPSLRGLRHKSAQTFVLIRTNVFSCYTILWEARRKRLCGMRLNCQAHSECASSEDPTRDENAGEEMFYTQKRRGEEVWYDRLTLWGRRPRRPDRHRTHKFDCLTTDAFRLEAASRLLFDIELVFFPGFEATIEFHHRIAG